MSYTHSEHYFNIAKTYIPGGVNSPVRAFKSVAGTPIFIKRGQGAYLFDEDDNQYIDYVGSFGPNILGHAPPEVVTAVQQQATLGLGFGTPTQIENEMASTLCHLVPGLEQVRMVNSGTEACMSALRLARGVTGRNKFIKFSGGYHGHADPFLVDAGSGAQTLGVPSSKGVPQATTQYTLIAEYNDLTQVEALFNAHGQDIAAVIVEPVAGNMNCILPNPGFLSGLRTLCDTYQSILIFDEVMTGFRVALEGAGAHYQVTPDLITLGKVIGGGLPVGAFGGKQALMEALAPNGGVYQAGTLSGNPMALSAGLATLKAIQAPGFYPTLKARTTQLLQGLTELAQAAHIPLTTQQAGSLFGLFFSSDEKITSFNAAKACNETHFKQFFHEMLAQGVYFAPSMYEAGFMSIAHHEHIINATLEKAEQVLTKMAHSITHIK